MIEPGERAIKFLENLTHIKGDLGGQRIKLEHWQAEPIRKIFGTLNEDGKRVIRRSLWFTPKKNGKTLIAAGLALVLLFTDQEQGKEIYSCAIDKEQAALTFNIAAEMIRANKGLQRHCKIIDSQKRIVYYPTNSFYRALSSESYSKNGVNASACIYDEYAFAPDNELMDVMSTSMAARSQPLLIVTTTAGIDKNSPGYQLYEYACDVRDGRKVDPSFLPVIYEAPAGLDYYDESNWANPVIWKQANPNYGISVKPQYFHEQVELIKNQPSELGKFLRYHLNVWTSAGEAKWIDSSLWAKCARPDYDIAELQGRTCDIGIDLSSTRDTCVASLLFEYDDGYVMLPQIYVPEMQAQERQKRDKVPYLDWLKAGHMVGTSGNVTDYDYIRNHIIELSKIYQIRDIAIDRWNAQQLITDLQNDGFNVIPYAQDIRNMTGPTKEFERLYVSGKLIHLDNPVTNWQAGNVVCREDANENVAPDKAKSVDRIDIIAATINALGRAMEHKQAGGSVYEERGLLAI